MENRDSQSLREAAGIRLDAGARVAYFGSRLMRLTRRETDLLSVFIEQPDRVLSRSELHALVWGRVDTTFRVVDAYVSRLRAKLRRAGHPGIGSVRMRGYLILSPSAVS